MSKTKKGEPSPPLVIIATPALDGRVEANFAWSLAETVALLRNKGFLAAPIFITKDALIQRARNDIFHMVHEAGADYCLFVDSDQGWSPEWVLELLEKGKDVIGLTTRRKTPEESYVVKTKSLKVDKDGLIAVEGLGTGFLLLSKKAIKKVYSSSPKYADRRMVFEVGYDKDGLISEDIMFTEKLRKLGFKLYLDPAHTCTHTGSVTFTGDFAAWRERLLEEQR